MQYNLYKLIFLVAVFLVSACNNTELDPHAKDIELRLAKLERVEMEFDATGLSNRKKEMLKALIKAGEQIHEAYLRQVDSVGVRVRDSIEILTDKRNMSIYRLIARNSGRFDRMDGLRNFVDDELRSPGGTFYPTGMSKEDFENQLALQPRKFGDFHSPYTVIRKIKTGLIAVPYHLAFAEWINPAAVSLNEASEFAENPSFKSFLKKRAEALLTDEYFESHLDWIDLKDSEFDILLSPNETHDDALLGLKASYTASVMVKNVEASRILNTYAEYLNELEQNLPIDAKYKRVVSGLSTPMMVVTDIYRGGSIATGYQAVAATFPSDPRVQIEKGTKKVFWKNVMDARVKSIVLPIARELIASDQIQFITAQGVFINALMQEMGRSIGPVYIESGTRTVPLTHALGERRSVLEEAKADVVGLYSTEYLVKKGIIPKEMERVCFASALASLFRTVRFGTLERHGEAAMCVLNYFSEKGAIRFDSKTQKWSVAFDKMPATLRELSHELLMLQVSGSFERTEAFFKKWSFMSKEVKQSLGRLAHLPVDIEPVYRVKWD